MVTLFWAPPAITAATSCLPMSSMLVSDWFTWPAGGMWVVVCPCFSNEKMTNSNLSECESVNSSQIGKVLIVSAVLYYPALSNFLYDAMYVSRFYSEKTSWWSQSFCLTWFRPWQEFQLLSDERGEIHNWTAMILPMVCILLESCCFWWWWGKIRSI